MDPVAPHHNSTAQALGDMRPQFFPCVNHSGSASEDAFIGIGCHVQVTIAHVRSVVRHNVKVIQNIRAAFATVKRNQILTVSLLREVKHQTRSLADVEVEERLGLDKIFGHCGDLGGITGKLLQHSVAPEPMKKAPDFL